MTVSVSMRYKEGKKAMKSLLGGMSSFRLATFLSVLIIPVVSFFRPIFGVGSSITLMFQAFVCARIGMDYCKSNRDKTKIVKEFKRESRNRGSFFELFSENEKTRKSGTSWPLNGVGFVKILRSI